VSPREAIADKAPFDLNEILAPSGPDQPLEEEGGFVDNFLQAVDYVGAHVLSVLESIRDITGLPWWATIAMSALTLRVFLVPLSYEQYKAQIHRTQCTLAENQLVYWARNSSLGPWKKAWKVRSYNKYMLKQHKAQLWRRLGGPLIQVSAIISMSMACRRMGAEFSSSDEVIPGLTTEGILWFTDLTLKDPFYVLPATGIALLYYGGVQMQKALDETQAKMVENGQSLPNWWLVLPEAYQYWIIFISPVFLQMPAAFCMYLIPSVGFTVLERSYRANKHWPYDVDVETLKQHPITLPASAWDVDRLGPLTDLRNPLITPELMEPSTTSTTTTTSTTLGAVDNNSQGVKSRKKRRRKRQQS
jgi:hypothetical protein